MIQLKTDITNLLDILWQYKPEERGIVKVYNKETKTHEDKQIFRSFRTYGKVPEFDPNIPKSYMYSESLDEIPAIFALVWASRRQYNQMLINWYEPEDYIEPHRDCTNFLAPNYDIEVVYISESIRSLVYTRVKDDLVEFIDLLNGINEYTITLLDNELYRHEIKPGEGRYLSMTFRRIKY